jgi:hypothetical protein
LRDQVVEVLPWSTALQNGERVAEVQGHLCKVRVSYNPDDQTLELDTALPATFGSQWQARADRGEFYDGSPEENFLFLRVWNRGDDLASPAAIPIANGTLGNTGLEVSFSGSPLRPGDHWIIAARPAAPEAIVPWQLKLPAGASPVGIRRFRAPLALLAWTTQGGVTSGRVLHDCRPPFLPLTRLRNCCTYRVGDGSSSFGDFTSIQAAIDALPAAGGQVCVLPGEYTENITISDRSNITLSGCGLRSRLTGRPPRQAGAAAAPVIHVRGGRNITIADLAIEAHESGPGLLLEGADPSIGQEQDVVDPLIGVMLSGLHVAAASRSAVHAVQARELTLRDSRIRMRDTSCLDTAVFVLGDDVLIERNVIEVPSSRLESPSVSALPASAEFLPGSLSRGGIQIGGTSERVRVVNNLIRGGAGNGITLGSLIFIDERNDPVPPRRWPRPRPIDPCDPKLPASSVLVITALPTDQGQVRQASAGTLTEILIEHNRIQQMGMNGIGVAGFFDLIGADEFISVEHLSILGNEIHGCLRRPLEAIPEAMVNSLGYGGIALADVEHLMIRDNVISNNGPSHLEPVCGIFTLHAEGLEISRNRILNNGAKVEAGNTEAKIGRRGGINVVYALAPVSLVRIGNQSLPAQNGEPALKVHDNIVSAPLGQALSVTALGPLSVVGNQFTSLGVVQLGPAATFFAATVAIFNLGLSTEFYLQFLAFSAIAKGGLVVDNLAAASAARPGLDDQRLGAYLAGGNVLFADNQCLLNVIEAGISVSASSVTIFSLDDIGFADNQCDCNLLDDLVFFHVVLFGISLRVSGNRLKEPLFNAFFPPSPSLSSTPPCTTRRPIASWPGPTFPPMGWWTPTPS